MRVPRETVPAERMGAWLERVVYALEIVQDLIVISLCIGLFSFMVLQLREMFVSLLPPLDFQVVTADILFLLILVELFRLLIIYLQEQRVSIGVAVEVSIVSVLREIIVRGVLEAPSTQILSACALLIVLGVLLVVRVWLPPTFEGIDPEKRLSMRRKLERELRNHETSEIPPRVIETVHSSNSSSWHES
ncbi:phosphate-starvation-inducible PsiE family protein [Leptodesmis sp.]|uniref:phosphate-starvation-inducible PsiE family protein n=1 Tax=Leptodesmis sp. TaxID=3100501 RepID=UPI0040535752